MTFDDIKKQMEALGFGYMPASSADILCGTFFRPITTTRPCVLNTRDQLAVELYDFARLNERMPKTYTSWSMAAEIRGEYVKDTWAKLNVYGLSVEKFVAEHERIQAALIRAWEALA